MNYDTQNPFTDYRAAAKALLAAGGLTQREGQFAGGVAFCDYPLSEKQLRWLSILLSRADLPELSEGGAA